MIFVKVQPLAINIISVFINAHVHGAVDVHQAHIHSHLVIVLGFGALDLFLLKLNKRLVIVRFKLKHTRALWRLEQSLANAV